MPYVRLPRAAGSSEGLALCGQYRRAFLTLRLAKSMHAAGYETAHIRDALGKRYYAAP